MEFQAFPSIPRLSKPMVITEKIDGTNGIIYIDDNCEEMLAGSRSRWLNSTKDGDNFGFCKWVEANRQELLKLGPGTHYGEWWGAGIQRRYGQIEKRFSLFNTGRWAESYKAMVAGHENAFPKCCSVVPVLYEGLFDTSKIEVILHDLKETGSIAAPGFMDPEGVVVFHSASRALFKKTFDDNHKGV